VLKKKTETIWWLVLRPAHNGYGRDIGLGKKGLTPASPRKIGAGSGGEEPKPAPKNLVFKIKIEDLHRGTLLRKEKGRG